LVSRSALHVDALVVGAGPAGLSAATALRTAGVARVLVLEREEEAGGTPRLCDHTGFGVRDLRRVLRGPAYARRWVRRASACGVEIRTHSMVTGWGEGRRALVTCPDGLFEIGAGVVVLATGARERPRPARLVPGTRPAGVFTTGQLQQWVHGRHAPLAGRALVVGAEHVSYSAVLTLREAGVEVVGLLTDLPRTQTFPLFDLVTRVGWRVPVWTGSTLTAVGGRDRLSEVLVRGPDGVERAVATDAVVFSGDFVPDAELARLAGAMVDPGTRGPACDARGATTIPGFFAAGNVVHPAETADVAAVRAAAVGRAAAAWLGDQRRESGSPGWLRLYVAEPLRWVVPNLAEPGWAGGGPMLLRSRVFLGTTRVQVNQGERLLADYRLRRLVPNRSHTLARGWRQRALPGEDVVISVS
jgi:thioredoxin reductase